MNKAIFISEKIREDCVAEGISPTSVGKILSNISLETTEDYGGNWSYYRRLLRRASHLFYLAGDN